ncbi:hypothetical protein KY290_003318 [Solanum tuberosum]|uniref:Amidase domain-containing protein n=2 Tax=Solanum tuberosum TaxID=4113 RepID=A0ABQ7WUU5_SOLTU|nr:hypothetical protein KY284_034899 [Solanum tuberosum]KAH0637691.1 hypothetical protein KY289_037606 [Solanum tuberosum]KAH0640827.1 hypothetical protein KY285_037413 [Solanum tuberosum]KAH0727618.1 hypothetical protein KY284_003483 [Solanum tuberosum]KAH0739364.1 hypothetical protein KY290_038069 [Solanum tuberosum]
MYYIYLFKICRILIARLDHHVDQVVAVQSVAANMAAVSLGTETHCSIICPADHNSVVGLKQPICRNVTDAVYMLDVIVGSDPRDEVTTEAAKYIPEDGYKQFLKEDGLKGKQIGIVKHPFVEMIHGAIEKSAFEHHLDLLRREGAILVDNLSIPHIEEIMDSNHSGEALVMMVEFKSSINAYLKELITSPVRSLADIIAFNERNSELEKLAEFDQHTFIEAEKTDGYGEEEKKVVDKLKNFSQNGFEKMMKDHKLDAMVVAGSRASPVFAIGGYPAITVPAGYESDGMPFGICFGGLKGTEPKLIEIAYAFEQSSKVRRPPPVI